MSDQIKGLAAAAIGAHRKDAMPAGMGDRPRNGDRSDPSTESEGSARTIADEAMATASDAAA